MEKIPKLRKHLKIIIKFIKLLAKSRRIFLKKKSQAFLFELLLIRIKIPKKRVKTRIQNIKISKYKIPACYQLYYSIVEYVFIFYLLTPIRDPTTKTKNRN